jgi:hypothetical protein
MTTLSDEAVSEHYTFCSVWCEASARSAPPSKVQPWQILVRDFPRVHPDFLDKLSFEGKFWDKLSEDNALPK